MLKRIALSIAVAVAVILACIFIGMLLATVPLPLVAAVGAFLSTYGPILGIVAGVWYFFTGQTPA